jgi:hypothetical protein
MPTQMPRSYSIQNVIGARISMFSYCYRLGEPASAGCGHRIIGGERSAGRPPRTGHRRDPPVHQEGRRGLPHDRIHSCAPPPRRDHRQDSLLRSPPWTRSPPGEHSMSLSRGLSTCHSSSGFFSLGQMADRQARPGPDPLTQRNARLPSPVRRLVRRRPPRRPRDLGNSALHGTSAPHTRALLPPSAKFPRSSAACGDTANRTIGSGRDPRR